MLDLMPKIATFLEVVCQMIHIKTHMEEAIDIVYQLVFWARGMAREVRSLFGFGISTMKIQMTLPATVKVICGQNKQVSLVHLA